VKIRTFIAFLFSALAVFAQPKAENKTDAQGLKQGYWEKVDPKTNKIIYKGTFKDGKPQGTFTYYYENADSVRSKSEFRQDGKVAYVTMFYATGKKEAKGKYVNEQKDSTWNFYDQRGGLLSTENYSNGKKDGVSKVYFENGKVSEEKNYKNGVLDGPYKMWYGEKKIKAEGKYVNGEYDGACAWYYPDGTAAAKGLYDKGKKNGVWLYKDKEGKVTNKEVWSNGVQLTGKQAEEYLQKNREALMGKEGSSSKGNAPKGNSKQNTGKK
jgi:antitoxin component YwqK of YwqJK toxin-antitoxin module